MIKNISAYEAFVVFRNFFLFGSFLGLGIYFGKYLFESIRNFLRKKKDR